MANKKDEENQRQKISSMYEEETENHRIQEHEMINKEKEIKLFPTVSTLSSGTLVTMIREMNREVYDLTERLSN